MSGRVAELNLLTDHHDRHWVQMEIACVEGRSKDAEFHRLEMGRGEERALEIEHQLQDEYRRRDAPFVKGQRVRFVNAPRLKGTVLKREWNDAEAKHHYTVVGDAEGQVLGSDYTRDDLEAL